jgi:SAM-dependent methyltransferase
MYEFHGDKARYFELTRKVTELHVIPFLKETGIYREGMRVLEIGCGEAGVLKAFTDKGCTTFGIELEESRLEYARQFMQPEMNTGKVAFLNKDIYDVDVEKDIGNTFDLVILKDVIEHIPNQEKFMPQLHKFLAPGGSVFFGFPPWCMPYGGHQQVLPGKLASRLPWYHLLPGPLYPMTLRLLGVSPSGINTMKEIRSTGISINRFLRICKTACFKEHARRFYLFNPVYEYKFGIKPRRQNALIAAIPWLRDFITMGVYFVVKPSPPANE